MVKGLPMTHILRIFHILHFALSKYIFLRRTPTQKSLTNGNRAMNSSQGPVNVAQNSDILIEKRNVRQWDNRTWSLPPNFTT